MARIRSHASCRPSLCAIDWPPFLLWPLSVDRERRLMGAPKSNRKNANCPPPFETFFNPTARRDAAPNRRRRSAAQFQSSGARFASPTTGQSPAPPPTHKPQALDGSARANSSRARALRHLVRDCLLERARLIHCAGAGSHSKNALEIARDATGERGAKLAQFCCDLSRGFRVVRTGSRPAQVDTLAISNRTAGYLRVVSYNVRIVARCLLFDKQMLRLLFRALIVSDKRLVGATFPLWPATAIRTGRPDTE